VHTGNHIFIENLFSDDVFTGGTSGQTTTIQIIFKSHTIFFLFKKPFHYIRHKEEKNNPNRRVNWAINKNTNMGHGEISGENSSPASKRTAF